MAAALVKSAKGTSTSGTVSWAFGSATTSGNLIVGCIAADDYNGSPTSGWTESSEMGQDSGGAFHGAYLWWRISTGETNPQAYTIGSATNSAWMLTEWSGLDAAPYDTSQGLLTNSSLQTYATDTITPTTGARLLVAMIGGAKAGDNSAVTISGWTNSFTVIDSIGSGGSGTNDVVGMAYRLVTGDGSTGFSTGADYGIGNTQQSRSALIISFKEATGGGSSIMRQMIQQHGG